MKLLHLFQKCDKYFITIYYIVFHGTDQWEKFDMNGTLNSLISVGGKLIGIN